jgi:glycosyltransferase involved in cell wall biosynthesis
VKVAFFVHCFFPQHFYGTETYTLCLAKQYRAAGHEVVVVAAIFQGEPSAGAVISRYDYQGIPVVCIDKNRIQHTRVRETYYQTDMRPVLEQVLREIQPDLVHVTHLINHTAALLEVAQQLDIATYATFTDFFGICLNNKLEAANGDLCPGPSKSRLNCVACHVKDASRNVNSPPWMRSATSPRSAQGVAYIANLARQLPGLRGGTVDRMIEDVKLRPDALLELYNGVYKGAVAPTRFLQTAYASNGIAVPMAQICFGVDIDRRPKPQRSADHRPVIAFIGQIAPHKGTDLLLKAFQRLPRGTAELRIYGSGVQDPGYMQLLQGIEQSCTVIFKGTFAAEQQADVFQEVDLLVIPSRWYENSPLVLLNALATHTPVLVSDVPGMTEFLDEGRNGFSFERGSVDDLSAQLARLVADPVGLYGLSRTTNYARTTNSMAQETFSIYPQN